MKKKSRVESIWMMMMRIMDEDYYYYYILNFSVTLQWSKDKLANYVTNQSVAFLWHYQQ